MKMKLIIQGEAGRWEIQCPFNLGDVEQEEMDAFKAIQYDIYQRYHTTQLIAFYDFESGYSINSNKELNIINPIELYEDYSVTF